DPCAHMTELVGCEHNSCTASEIGLNEPGNRGLTLRGPIGIHKHAFRTVSDYCRRDAVAIFDQHLDDLWRYVESHLGLLVFHLPCGKLQARDGAGLFANEQVGGKGELGEVFWSHWHIGQDGYAECCLR